MSAQTLIAWEKMSPAWVNHLEQTRLATNSSQRPNKQALEIVGRILAGGVIPEKGYTDLTYEQIETKARGSVRESEIKRALGVLHRAQVFVAVSRPTRGKQGKPGRAPKRIPFFTTCADPNHSAPDRATKLDESQRANDRITARLDPNHSAPDRAALIQIPYTNPLAGEITEQDRLDSANSPTGEKEQKKREQDSAHSTGLTPMQTALVQQVAEQAQQQAAKSPGFKPGAAWWRSTKPAFKAAAAGMVQQFPGAPIGALVEATCLDHYAEFYGSEHKHAALLSRLTGATQNAPQGDAQDLAAALADRWTLPPTA